MTDHALRILEQLVGFDTVSAKPNLTCVEYIRDLLHSSGVASEIFYNGDRSKAGLVATIGAKEAGGIMLSGHTDVVPVDGQRWSSDPFVLRKEGGKLFGRGATDMKGFLALILAAVPEMVRAPLACPIHIALSYDEELACAGTSALIKALLTDARRPNFAIVGEPTGWTVMNRHKGSCVFRTLVQGAPAHSSRPCLGINAISHAARIITYLDGLAASREGTQAGDAGVTLNVARIQGGEADNIVPERCDVVWGVRSTDPEEISSLLREVDSFVAEVVLPDMRRSGLDVEVTRSLEKEVPGLEPCMASHALASLVADLVRDGAPPTAAPFGTEAGHFARAGIPSVVCGPGFIAQAHQPDEWLALEQLEQGEAFLKRLVGWARTHTGGELANSPGRVHLDLTSY